jgi:hypothetical protein
LIIGLLAPAGVVLGLDIFVKGRPLVSAITDPYKGPFAKDMCCWKPFFLGFALLPFVALSILIWLASKRITTARVILIELFGLLGILAVTIPAHIDVWYPLYGGGHMSSTAVVAFVFIPFFAMGGMALGAFLGWLISLLPPLRKPDKV